MYYLILGSRKPRDRAFGRLITNEVLPARQTGFTTELLATARYDPHRGPFLCGSTIGLLQERNARQLLSLRAGA